MLLDAAGLSSQSRTAQESAPGADNDGDRPNGHVLDLFHLYQNIKP
jgi:hypothetical protein